jgi:hypothetical protein
MGKEVAKMLSLELLGILGLLLGFLDCVMVVTQLERRSLRIAERKAEAEKATKSPEQPLSVNIEHQAE